MADRTTFVRSLLRRWWWWWWQHNKRCSPVVGAHWNPSFPWSYSCGFCWRSRTNPGPTRPRAQAIIVYFPVMMWTFCRAWKSMCPPCSARLSRPAVKCHPNECGRAPTTAGEERLPGISRSRWRGPRRVLRRHGFLLARVQEDGGSTVQRRSRCPAFAPRTPSLFPARR